MLWQRRKSPFKSEHDRPIGLIGRTLGEKAMTRRTPHTERPLWASYHAAQRVPAITRRHRPVHHRHGFVFGFPLCSATELDEYLDDTAGD